MSRAKIEIPSTLNEAVRGTLGEEPARRWALEALVLTAVGDNLISTGQAAEILGLGYFDTLALIKARGLVLRLRPEEIEKDDADLRRISAAIDLK